MVNDTAAKDDICQQVMASYIAQLKAEAAPDCQWGEWHISDRD